MNGFILRRIDEHGIISLCRRHGRLTVEPNTQGIGKETGREKIRLFLMRNVFRGS